VARLIFRNYWTFTALLAALSEWLLWWWFVEPHVAPAVHVGLVALLLGLNRLAAFALEHERHHRPVARALGMGTLALGFGSAVVAGSVAALAVAWSVVGGLAALPAAAVGAAPALPLADPGFRLLGGAGATASACMMLYGYWRGHRALEIERRTLVLPALPPGLDGLRVVHVSDLHVGPLADRAALADAFARIVALDPDLVCVTGDIVDSARTDIEAWTPLLATLTARRGIFAILGNHDRDAGAERVAQAITHQTGWQLLRDTVATLDVDGSCLHLLGLEDRRPPCTTDRLPSLVAGVPAGGLAVLLAHHPDAFDEAAAAAIPLTLAGHTHGGQLAVPYFPHLNVARFMISRRSVGWFRQDGQYLHVSAGLGVSGQRVRVGMPCEITEITLARPLDAVAA
jgi:predicted MPP superfamily phosphohydrolase